MGRAVSDVECDIADRDADAQLDLGVGLAADLAGADVAGAPGAPRLRAAETDAHATPVFRRETGRLGLFEQWCAGVRRGDPALREAHGAARLRVVGRAHRSERELLGVESVVQPGAPVE